MNEEKENLKIVDVKKSQTEMDKRLFEKKKK